MKKLYSKLLTLVTIGFYSLSVWAQDAPVIQNYSDYTGDSFVANWDKVSGADKYFLNVYTNGTNVQNLWQHQPLQWENRPAIAQLPEWLGDKRE